MALIKPVVFNLNEELYGVDINLVQGIEKEQQIVRVPNTVSYIKGIINLRGEIIPVYDLKRKFNIASDDNADMQYIIVRVRNSFIALEVDGVKEIHEVLNEDLFEMPSIVNSSNTSYFDRVIRSGKTLIIVINVDNLLTEDEIKKLDEITSQ